jgi:hypothetical protein
MRFRAHLFVFSALSLFIPLRVSAKDVGDGGTKGDRAIEASTGDAAEIDASGRPSIACDGALCDTDSAGAECAVVAPGMRPVDATLVVAMTGLMGCGVGRRWRGARRPSSRAETR